SLRVPYTTLFRSRGRRAWGAWGWATAWSAWCRRSSSSASWATWRQPARTSWCGAAGRCRRPGWGPARMTGRSSPGGTAVSTEETGRSRRGLCRVPCETLVPCRAPPPAAPPPGTFPGGVAAVGGGGAGGGRAGPEAGRRGPRLGRAHDLLARVGTHAGERVRGPGGRAGGEGVRVVLPGGHRGGRVRAARGPRVDRRDPRSSLRLVGHRPGNLPR